MKKRIMVVDDSCIMEAQISEMLVGTEFEVVAYCENGEDAIAGYADLWPDVVTMDIIMPGIDGLEAAQIILEEHPEARIVMVSSLAYGDTFERAKAIGAKGFIDKPFYQEQLVRQFEEALA